MPEPDTVTPVRYMANPKYTSLQEQKEQEQTDASTKNSSEIGKCYTDEDGIQYFYLTEQMGWKFKILDAVAGSRFYGLQKNNRRRKHMGDDHRRSLCRKYRCQRRSLYSMMRIMASLV